MRALNEIVVHCSATRRDWMDGARSVDKVAEIRRWHVRDRGWKDIGYHYLIDRNGTVVTGRPLETIGAHTQGHNTGTVGVCLIGGHGSAETDKFEQNFTAQQDNALRKVLADLIRKYPSIRKVSGHNQYAAKACPGFNVPSWYAGARASVARAEIQAATASQSPRAILPPALGLSWMERLVSALSAMFGKASKEKGGK